MTARDEPCVLTINSGSSSLKFALIGAPGAADERVLEGAAVRLGQRGSSVSIRRPGAPPEELVGEVPDHRAAIDAIFAAMARSGAPRPTAVGHRIVHGGPTHSAPVLVDRDLLASLRSVVAFAPLHLPPELAGIEAVAERYPDLPQVVSFDTAFHAELPQVAARFPLPDHCHERGIRRYGFHGLSYTYVVSRLGPRLRARTIVAHLGNGSSLVALRDGAPIDTTMGLTPCGGIMMGTRSGDLDPGVLSFLLREGTSTDDLDHLVNHESGLLGVSGTTSDMQTLLERRARDPRARLAVEMFCYQLRKAVGALAAALGGVELLVFTGGIGSHAPAVRAATCDDLGYLGIHLDASRNAASEDVISSATARCTVRVITTDEELVIARNTRNVLSSRDQG